MLSRSGGICLDFVPAPGGDWRSLLDPDYLNARADLIGPQRMPQATPGRPGGAALAFAPMGPQPEGGTSHIGIVDAQGNMLAMTTTIESAFGSRLMVRGFMLNNELTDFNFAPVQDGALTANAVAPGKRPRSSMAPTMVFDAGGRLEMLAGSPGGSLIIGYVAKALIATLDWNLDPQAAVDLPNFGSRNGPTEVEQGTELEGVKAALKAMGHEVRAIPMTSGLRSVNALTASAPRGRRR